MGGIDSRFLHSIPVKPASVSVLILIKNVSVSTVQQDHSQLIRILLGVNATTVQQDIFGCSCWGSAFRRSSRTADLQTPQQGSCWGSTLRWSSRTSSDALVGGQCFDVPAGPLTYRHLMGVNATMVQQDIFGCTCWGSVFQRLPVLLSRLNWLQVTTRLTLTHMFLFNTTCMDMHYPTTYRLTSYTTTNTTTLTIYYYY